MERRRERGNKRKWYIAAAFILHFIYDLKKKKVVKRRTSGLIYFILVLPTRSIKTQRDETNKDERRKETQQRVMPSSTVKDRSECHPLFFCWRDTTRKKIKRTHGIKNKSTNYTCVSSLVGNLSLDGMALINTDFLLLLCF